jgi:hypothetical protein
LYQLGSQGKKKQAILLYQLSSRGKKKQAILLYCVCAIRTHFRFNTSPHIFRGMFSRFYDELCDLGFVFFLKLFPKHFVFLLLLV